MAKAAFAAVIGDLADDEMQLDIGYRCRRARLQKAAGLGEVRGDHAAPFPPVAADFADQARDASEGNADKVAAFGTIGKDEIDVILKIAADGRQIVNDLDAEFPQMAALAHAREHEQLRRLKGAAR